MRPKWWSVPITSTMSLRLKKKEDRQVWFPAEPPVFFHPPSFPRPESLSNNLLHPLSGRFNPDRLAPRRQVQGWQRRTAELRSPTPARHWRSSRRPPSRRRRSSQAAGQAELQGLQRRIGQFGRIQVSTPQGAGRGGKGGWLSEPPPPTLPFLLSIGPCFGCDRWLRGKTVASPASLFIMHPTPSSSPPTSFSRYPSCGGGRHRRRSASTCPQHNPLSFF